MIFYSTIKINLCLVENFLKIYFFKNSKIFYLIKITLSKSNLKFISLIKILIK